MCISDWSSHVCSSDLDCLGTDHVAVDRHKRLLDGALGRLGYRLNGLQLLYGIGFRQRATVDAAGDQSGLVDHIEIGRRHARVGVQEPLDTLRRAGEPHRSEERRGGKECVRTGSTWWAAD